jgi:AcrR family transcriptional regulator
MVSRQPHAYAKVLDAAEKVLLERSAAAFTLDAVAAQAQVSKGGLMYHFPSKEALLAALVARAVTAVDEALTDAAAATTPGAFTRAYLDITIPDTPPDPDAAGHEALVAALAAAVALDPRLLGPLRDAYARWQDRLENDGIDPAAATTVRLAVDGWWLAALLGLPPLSADVHRRTRTVLEQLTGSTAASSGRVDPSASTLGRRLPGPLPPTPDGHTNHTYGV